jgi:hypothetical protein
VASTEQFRSRASIGCTPTTGKLPPPLLPTRRPYSPPPPSLPTLSAAPFVVAAPHVVVSSIATPAHPS